MNNYPQNQSPYQPPYQPPQYQPPYILQDPGKGTGTGSLVFGIIGLGTAFLGLICGIIGIILALISGSKSRSAGLRRNGLATAGLICSIISVVIGIIFLVVVVAFFVVAYNAADSTVYYHYSW